MADLANDSHRKQTGATLSEKCQHDWRTEEAKIADGGRGCPRTDRRSTSALKQTRPATKHSLMRPSPVSGKPDIHLPRITDPLDSLTASIAGDEPEGNG